MGELVDKVILINHGWRCGVAESPLGSHTVTSHTHTHTHVRTYGSLLYTVGPHTTDHRATEATKCCAVCRPHGGKGVKAIPLSS